MKSYKQWFVTLVALTLLGFGARIARSQDNSGSSNTIQVHMVITDEALRDDSEVPILQPAAVQVKQGKTSLKVTHLILARGDNAALQLFIHHPNLPELHRRSRGGSQGGPPSARQFILHG